MKKISFVLVIIVLMISCSQKKDNIQATLQGNYFCNAIYVKEHADPILGWWVGFLKMILLSLLPLILFIGMILLSVTTMG